MPFELYGYFDGSLVLPRTTVRNPENIRNRMRAYIVYSHYYGTWIDLPALLVLGALRRPEVFIGYDVADRRNGGYFHPLGAQPVL